MKAEAEGVLIGGGAGGGADGGSEMDSSSGRDPAGM